MVGNIDEGNYLDGGDILMTAGKTTASARFGGRVVLKGGIGESRHSIDGGDGGNIDLYGGEAIGEGQNDNGGNIELCSGKASSGHGGSLRLTTGQSASSSSDSMLINAAPSESNW